MKKDIVSVKYEDKFALNAFVGKTYNYYTDIDVKIGDLVIAPTASGEKIARVSEVNISEEKIQNIRQYLKNIECKIDKEQYLQNRVILKKVA